MTRRRVILAACLLMCASPLLAQSRGSLSFRGASPRRPPLHAHSLGSFAQRASKADPITGTWTGQLTLEGSGRVVSVTMELKLDGKGAITGTISGLPNPADVKRGTFDSKSGALTLELGKTAGKAVLLRLEGSVVKGTATGRFTGDESGPFKLVKKP